MQLNDAGKIVAKEWIKTAEIRNKVELDEWIIMPNHFHSIIKITQRRGTACRAHLSTPQFATPIPNSLPTIIRSFKSAVTKGINELNQQPGTKLWQRNYWEHIIRNIDELYIIRHYIICNPFNWQADR
jgi:REP element-mobilizing transposase RayT